MKSKTLRKKIVIYAYKLDYKVGGIVALHNLAKDLLSSEYDIYIYPIEGKGYKNEFCNNFAKLIDIDDSTIVVYPEVIEGNPLKAKKVVRWLLCDLGIHCSKDIYKTWSTTDLVFHFSTFNANYDPFKINYLYTIWIDPKVKNLKQKRSGSCYLYKKASLFHKNIKLIHPKNSLLIDNLNYEEIIKVFNKKEYFYCYDPYSFYNSIAALCGCIPIIYPIAGITKLNWLKTLAKFQPYLKTHENFPGISYGIDDILYAKKTIKNVEKVYSEVVEYGKKSVDNFLSIVSDYFFNKNNNKVYNTVGKAIKTFSWKNSNNKVGAIIKQKDNEIANLLTLSKQKDNEIAIIKSARFFKLWQRYCRIRDNILRKFK